MWPFKRKKKEVEYPFIYQWKIVHADPYRWEVWRFIIDQFEPCGKWWLEKHYSYDYGLEWFYSERSALAYIKDEERKYRNAKEDEERRKAHIVTEKIYEKGSTVL